MCICLVERSAAKSKHLPKDTIPLDSACHEILRLRPTGFAQNDRHLILHYSIKITYLPIFMQQKNSTPKSVWGIVLKVIIAVASAVAGAFGISACGN